MDLGRSEVRKPTMRNLHTDPEYEAELRQVHERLLLMAGRVEKMIADSTRSVVERDVELAQATIEADGRVNQAELELDELCMLILAKRQPMASDLRFITLTLKMVTDLERIGDLAVNICERARELSRQPQLIPYHDLPRMSEIVQSMVHDAINAFIDGDAAQAQAIIDRDDEVDDLYHRIFRELLKLMLEDTSAVERGIHVQSVVKWLERMADHATNLAEQVFFIIEGEDIRHGRRTG